MKTLYQIAEENQFLSWIEIQNKAKELHEIKPIDEEERTILSSLYKELPLVSYENINFAKKLYTIKGIELKKPYEIKVILKNGFPFINTTSGDYKPSALISIFECFECKKDFKVELNPARGMQYYSMPFCKACKKKVLHKCKDYNKTYEESMIKKHGCRRPIQSKEIRKNFINTMNERYGVSYSGQSPELISKANKTKLSFSSKGFFSSKLETDVFNFLIKNNIQCIQNMTNDKVISFTNKNTRYYPDIIYGNIIIEVYGDYWHGNPKIYDENAKVARDEIAQERWTKDAERKKYLEEQGYAVIIIWESDWHQDKTKVLKEINDIRNSTTFLFRE